MIWWPILILLAVLVAALFALFVFGKKGGLVDADKKRFFLAWEAILELTREDNEAAWAKAIFEADKLLDFVLRQMGRPGNSLGERLKNSKTLFSNVDVVWRAHKVRNELMHEVGRKLTKHETEIVISNFKSAFAQLGLM